MNNLFGEIPKERLSNYVVSDYPSSTHNHIFENSTRINNAYTDSSLRLIQVGDAIVYHANHIIKQNEVIPYRNEFLPIQMQFLLEGERTGNSKATGKEYPLHKSQHNLFHFPNSKSDYSLAFKSDQVSMFMIQFTKSHFWNYIDEGSKVLSQFWEGILKNEEALLEADRPLIISPKVRAIILQIININLKGNLKRLFIEAKINELFIEQVQLAEANRQVKAYTIHKADKDKLYMIKEQLDKSTFENFSLVGLAKQSGLNEYKLKKGFKALFGKTVFGYLSSLRLEYARYLLLEENKDVAEVSDILGYSLPHHFAKAFKKKFGYSPGKLKFYQRDSKKK